MADPLISELAEYQRGFRQNRELARHICTNLRAEVFDWRPADRRWSVAECLTHLNIAATLFSDATRHDGSSTRLGPPDASRLSPFATVSCRGSCLVTRSRQPTTIQRPPKFVLPDTTYDVEPVLEAFVALQQTWEEYLRATNGLDLERIRVPSPAIGLLRFPLGATFAIQVSHERRHLHQARGGTALTDFPGVPAEDS